MLSIWTCFYYCWHLTRVVCRRKKTKAGRCSRQLLIVFLLAVSLWALQIKSSIVVTRLKSLKLISTVFNSNTHCRMPKFQGSTSHFVQNSHVLLLRTLYGTDSSNEHSIRKANIFATKTSRRMGRVMANDACTVVTNFKPNMWAGTIKLAVAAGFPHPVPSAKSQIAVRVRRVIHRHRYH